MRIHIGESDRWHGKTLYQAIVELRRRENFSGVTVLRGVGGYGGASIYHTEKILQAVAGFADRDRSGRVGGVDRGDSAAAGRDDRRGLVSLEKVRVILYRSEK